MKYLLYLLALTLLVYSCATTNKMADEVFNNAIVGQNVMTIYSRVGRATSISPEIII